MTLQRRGHLRTRRLLAAVLVSAVMGAVVSGPAGAQSDDDAVEDVGEDGTSDDGSAGASAAAPARVPESPPRYTDDPWADPVLRWPDPLAESQLGVEPTYYWFARDDRRSLLPAATPERPLAVWAGGDSISGGPVYGFRQLIAEDERFVFTEDILKSTGVVSEWYFDWVDYMATEISEGPYDVIVLAMGANDRQRFRGFPERFGEPEWNERYQDRVRDLVAAAAKPGRLVIWVGLPPLQPRFFAALPEVVNPLVEAAVAYIDGVIYMDSFEVLAVDGEFARRLGPGQRNIRTQDGIHYTYYGGVVLTEPILAEIARRSG